MVGRSRRRKSSEIGWSKRPSRTRAVNGRRPAVKEYPGPPLPLRGRGTGRTGAVAWNAPLVLELLAVVLEDPADRGEDDRERAEEDHPPADRDADRGEGHGERHEQRPPAVRAEEPVLAGVLGDVAVQALLRRQAVEPLAAAGGLPEPEADHPAEADRDNQDDEARPLDLPLGRPGPVAVERRRQAEEGRDAHKQICLHLHGVRPTSRILLLRGPHPGPPRAGGSGRRPAARSGSAAAR